MIVFVWRKGGDFQLPFVSILLFGNFFIIIFIVATVEIISKEKSCFFLQPSPFLKASAAKDENLFSLHKGFDVFC
ncbi:hypothetical protein CISIN_1g039879mg [Citrus sinensis]|uniref:Uncharacterized protein n=1 Tax=Citrus sinensis TaxID=2711 RepID=A0A067DLC3_CITSI|nr:hypothetical protein CISIN_1g039879mg [Citrus sinensis]